MQLWSARPGIGYRCCSVQVVPRSETLPACFVGFFVCSHLFILVDAVDSYAALFVICNDWIWLPPPIWYFNINQAVASESWIYREVRRKGAAWRNLVVLIDWERDGMLTGWFLGLWSFGNVDLFVCRIQRKGKKLPHSTTLYSELQIIFLTLHCI